VCDRGVWQRALAHDVAHVWLGETALSDAHVAAESGQAIERWCSQTDADVQETTSQISVPPAPSLVTRN